MKLFRRKVEWSCARGERRRKERASWVKRPERMAHKRALRILAAPAVGREFLARVDRSIARWLDFELRRMRVRVGKLGYRSKEYCAEAERREARKASRRAGKGLAIYQSAPWIEESAR